MKRARTREGARRLRHRRIRRKLWGTAVCPRMAVMISNKHITVQLIDDDAGQTLAAASTVGTSLSANVASAQTIGAQIGEAGKARGIERAIVDRGGLRYQGRVRALVDAAVEGGLRIRRTPVADAEVKEAS